MNSFSYIHLLCAQIYVILAIVVLLRDRKSLINQLCSLIFICFFIWSFSWTFIQNLQVSKETAVLFENIGSFGWLLFSPFFVWFSVLYAKKQPSRFFLLYLSMLFIFPVVLIVIVGPSVIQLFAALN